MLESKVAVFTSPNTPITLITERTPPPSPTSLLIRVSHAGVCGSDLHRLTGDYPPPPAPISFGHEGVGTIAALGALITHDRAGAPLSPGDRIYWGPSTPCGAATCAACAASTPMKCPQLNWPVLAGRPNAAAYRTFATLSEKHFYYKIPEGTSAESVIAFGCAMPTALRAFARLGTLERGANVVVQGSGPVGLAMTVLAGLAGARAVVVIGDPEVRLQAAGRLGATHVLSVSGSTVEERRRRVMEITGGRGASVVVEAAGVPAAFPEGFELLGMNGRFLIVGLYSGKAVYPVDAVRINNFNLSIIGSVGIEPENYKRTVEIAEEHGKRLGFEELITHRFKLENVEEAIRAVVRPDAVKIVVMP
ncbi:mycothiol-dependent formaldehyde dehydrogenase [Mytilinidion resinicola]|uniref:Mycothiol-dependent formaldehyde dehydrogenase n=1 Tax=Mytilinidion resinicola TaxID=574789 RepID=A0A6A6YQT2_9PEZI|nr:mycothiol-dependent formaldehyde dehydrogenase [Mytilinidion resinicola]KAF2811262.1 mycothiol-dependent formaldehyde dehydrogenase [Mytilinidion resinicola]